MGLFTAAKVHGFALFGDKNHRLDAGADVGTVTPGLNAAFAAGTPTVGFTFFNINGNGAVGAVLCIGHSGFICVVFETNYRRLVKNPKLLVDA